MRDRSKISTDLPIPLKARTFEELYANPQPLRNDGRWYWEYLWKMCKEDDKPRRRFFIDRAQWRPGPPTELRIASPDFAELCRTRMSEQSEQSQEWWNASAFYGFLLMARPIFPMKGCRVSEAVGKDAKLWFLSSWHEAMLYCWFRVVLVKVISYIKLTVFNYMAWLLYST